MLLPLYFAYSSNSISSDLIKKGAADLATPIDYLNYASASIAEL